ncbi:MAG: hypothetical protein WBW35_21430 [Xanthobacteraceae bacterium]
MALPAEHADVPLNLKAATVPAAGEQSKRLFVAPATQAEFAASVVESTEKWGNVIRTANIKPE